MIAGVPTGALVVFGVIFLALVTFVTELVPNDVTAIGIIVTLALLEPITGVGPRTAISGFASTATITIVGMYMLSAGIQGTGLVQRLGAYLASVSRGSHDRALVATVLATGPVAGFVNNTPVVATYIPMITELADTLEMSPSRLLMPLSFAAILGGTLTLIGTATNLIASEFAVTLLGRGPIRMFEFTALGVIILVVGIGYLLTVGRWLTPARIPPTAGMVEEFDLEDHLSQLRVGEDSEILGRTPRQLEAVSPVPIRILQVRHGNVARTDGGSEVIVDAPIAPGDGDGGIEPGDVLTIHGTLQAVNRFAVMFELQQLARADVTEETFTEPGTEGVLAKLLIPPSSTMAGTSIAESHFREIYETTVLAIRREGELIRTGLGEIELQPGDLLLVQTDLDAIGFFYESDEVVLIEETQGIDVEPAESGQGISPKAPVAVGIMLAVVLSAAIGLVSIVIAALGGVVAMILTGCLTSREAYDAVSWDIVFLLAGVLPLGIALEATGGSVVIADLVVGTAAFLPTLLVLLFLTILTGMLANMITPVATIVLMAPIAVDAAAGLGAPGFSFLLAVMFASATSFMTPVGYQTNLMVYGPGGYTFADFLRVGGPLQLLLAVVITLGVAGFWGIG